MDKFLSIDEFKVSALIIAFFVFVVATLISFFILGTVPPAFIDLLQSLIFAIGGVNAVNGIRSIFTGNSNNNNINPTDSVNYNNINRSNTISATSTTSTTSGTKPKI